MADRQTDPSGACVTLGPGFRRILAPNPSPMTQNGTNTYILGTGNVAVIDPGPANAAHLEAIMAALSAGERISHILVTHAHLDHSGLARRLAGVSGAPVYAYGGALSGRSDAMTRLAALGLVGGGEGLDLAFAPDVILTHGARVTGDGWAVDVVHTPGHLGGHLCFASGNVLFSGDHVMGWSTSLVSPPDGDMADYMASLDLLAQRRWDTFLPAHGDPVADPSQRINDLIAHRRAREAALLHTLRTGAHDIGTLTRRLYADLAEGLLPAAQRNVFAHLIDLETRKLVRATPGVSETAVFTCR